MIIYKITNNYNGKIYIGKTIHDLQYRWKQHINKSKKSGRKYLLHNAIAKYGAASFTIDIIEICTTNKELCEREKLYIKQYSTFNNCTKGYNMTEGGDDGVLSDEAKDRKRIAMNTPEYKEKIHKTSIGRIFTPESIEKRAIQLRGQKRTTEHKEHMRQAAIGRTNSTEHRKKISDSMKGKGRGVYFKVYNQNVCLGVFDNIKSFCQTTLIMSDVSLKQLLYGKKHSCKGYTAYYSNAAEYDSFITNPS